MGSERRAGPEILGERAQGLHLYSGAGHGRSTIASSMTTVSKLTSARTGQWTGVPPVALRPLRPLLAGERLTATGNRQSCMASADRTRCPLVQEPGPGHKG
jgi:hypothetical protein